jgi:hypothetical protein
VEVMVVHMALAVGDKLIKVRLLEMVVAELFV